VNNKKIMITINGKRMNAIQDAFFKTLNTKSYEKIKPTLIVIWREICEENGK